MRPNLPARLPEYGGCREHRQAGPDNITVVLGTNDRMTMASNRTDYLLPGWAVLRDASEEEIKHAYYEAAQRPAPDKNQIAGKLNYSWKSKGI